MPHAFSAPTRRAWCSRSSPRSPAAPSSPPRFSPSSTPSASSASSSCSAETSPAPRAPFPSCSMTRSRASTTPPPIAPPPCSLASASWPSSSSTPPPVRGAPAVLEFSLDARRGSLQLHSTFAAPWTVIFGHSGAGKSTFLRLLAGLDRLHTGSARVVHQGRVLTDTASNLWLPPGRRQTALVAQQPTLFPHLSVHSNVAYGLAHLDRETRNQRMNEMLQLVGAMDLINRPTSSLSGGESQRIALARALAPGPELLLLDEPFSALDGASADTLLARLHGWARARGIQTIQATHDATDAFITDAEVMLLHEGKIAAQGSAADVLVAERARLLSWLEPDSPAPRRDNL